MYSWRVSEQASISAPSRFIFHPSNACDPIDPSTYPPIIYYYTGSEPVIPLSSIWLLISSRLILISLRHQTQIQTEVNQKRRVPNRCYGMVVTDCKMGYKGTNQRRIEKEKAEESRVNGATEPKRLLEGKNQSVAQSSHKNRTDSLLLINIILLLPSLVLH